MATDQNIKNKVFVWEIETAYDRYMMGWTCTCRTVQESFPAILHLFLTYKCRRKPLLGNLFVIGRIFFGRLRPEDIKYCHSWKLKTAESWNCWNICRFFWWYQWYFPISFSALQLAVSVIFIDIIFRFAVDCISDIFRHRFLRNESNFPAR